MKLNENRILHFIISLLSLLVRGYEFMTNILLRFSNVLQQRDNVLENRLKKALFDVIPYYTVQMNK
uniref:Uncharacterized protein n=1 Tax=Glossina brevipalpis TaxID=37001 RepID=A0A1A9W5A3_9MUSC